MQATLFIATTGEGIARASLLDDGEWSVQYLLPDHDVRALAYDPLNPKVIFAGTQGDGIMGSTDGGETWVPVGLVGRVVKSIAFSPLEPGVVYAGTKPPQLFVSRDGGENWREMESFRSIPSRDSWWSPAESPGTAYVQAIALSPTDPRTIVAGVEFGAVVQSADGGTSWTDHREGALPDCHTLTFHSRDGNWVYEGGSAGAGAAFSRDAGVTWSQPENGLDRHYGWAVAADPGNPEIFYISVSPSPMNAHGGRDAQAAIFRWTGGSRWDRLSGGLPNPMKEMPYALITHPGHPGHLYAGFSHGDVWWSGDYGDNWQKLPFSMGRVHRTVIMPV